MANYNSLMIREYKSKFRFFKFYKYFTEGELKDSTFINDFSAFLNNFDNIKEELINTYKRCSILAKDESILNIYEGKRDLKLLKQKSDFNINALDFWNRVNDFGNKRFDTLTQINNTLYKIFKEYFEKLITIDEFEEICKPDACYYCGITRKNLDSLLDSFLIFKDMWKQGKGWNFEVDRTNYEYKKGEIVLCCYWCNNAKTDEFSAEEFKEFIAPGIRKSWNERLDSI
ncbi:MAG: hypothetical protein HPY53_03620 [Brevinematales bacterium]|nr:hypothetical protein [Brevinematales bacterium]